MGNLAGFALGWAKCFYGRPLCPDPGPAGAGGRHAWPGSATVRNSFFGFPLGTFGPATQMDEMPEKQTIALQFQY